LQDYHPASTEERALQILGLLWEGTATSKLAHCSENLLQEQREDGGWAQLPTLESDAYATGLALYALQQGGGVSSQHPAVKKGIRFLLERQLSDGSWWVETRASAVQVAIDGIFPHGEDQWISSSATGWSANAIMTALEK
jgi:squalene cyclase